MKKAKYGKTLSENFESTISGGFGVSAVLGTTMPIRMFLTTPRLFPRYDE
jgi:hypothetical protein